jgi:uncharacterized protein YggE
VNQSRLPSVLLLTGALAILALLLLLGIPSAKKAPIAPELRHITAIGEAEVKVKPDQAIFRLQVQIPSISAVTAEAAHRRQLDQFAARLREVGVDGDRIQTGPISVHELPEVKTGLTWMAESEVRVTLKDLTKVDDVVDAILSERGARLTATEYGLSSPEPQVQKALDAALASARTRAEGLASGASGQLGAPIDIEMIGAPVIQGDSPELVRLKLTVKATFPM